MLNKKKQKKKHMKNKKAQNRINKSENNNFPGGPWQEAQSVYAWKDGHPDAKEKLFLSYLKIPQLNRCTFFFSWQPIEALTFAKARGLSSVLYLLFMAVSAEHIH